MVDYSSSDTADSNSSYINDIVQYSKEKEDEISFYRVTGPVDHWITAVGKNVWGLSDKSDFDSIEEGDVLLFHATSSAANSEVSSKKSGIIGAGVVSNKRTKDEPWWWAEHKEGDNWSYIVDLEPMMITGSPESINRNKEITDKTINEIEKETYALLENFMPMSEADEICQRINDKGFPNMGSRSGFRDQNDKIDTEAPIEILRGLKPNLKNVEHVDTSSVSQLNDHQEKYYDETPNIPEQVKKDLDLMVQHSQNNRGSFTRLFGVKAFLDIGKDEVTDDELKDSVKENYSDDLPGTRGAYLQNRHKAFQKEMYSSFEETEEGHRIKPEYVEYRPQIKEYVDQLWQEAVSSVNYFVISHNSKPNQLEKGYLQAPYTSSSDDYEDNYQPSHDLSKLKKGDKVLHYQSRRFIGYSIVEEEPEVRENEEGDKEFYLDVNIHRFDEPRTLSQVREFLKEEKDKVDSYYVMDSKGGKAEGYLKVITEKGFNHILHGKHTPPIDIDEKLAIELSGDLLNDELYFPGDQDEEIINQVQAALNSGKNIIFTGPPGTGKTEIAEAVAKELEDTDYFTGHQLTTATADWSTFDTVGGFMPEKEGDGDLEFNSGQILKRFKDNNRPLKNELLVIDEINRADIDKAFGQLFTVLSGQKVQLPFTADNDKEIEVIPGGNTEATDRPDEHQFIVSESWRILATMNTYDKTSLYEMSYAFMRRFAFIRVDAPEENLNEHIRNYNDKWNVNADEKDLDAIAGIWKETNSAVDGRKIGPALAKDMLGFVAESNGSDVYTEAVVNYIFPQLEGVRKNDQIVKKIAESDNVDETKLKQVARDMLQVKFDE